MDWKNILVPAVAVLALVVGLIALNKPSQVADAPVGALSGPDIISNYLSWGGVRTERYSMAMANASTTCSFATPAATSTLAFFHAGVDNSPTYSTVQYEFGLAATAYATTTSLGRGVMAEATQGTLTASTTQIDTGDIVDQNITLPPNTYVNLKVGTSSPTGQSGNCYIGFQVIP